MGLFKLENDKLEVRVLPELGGKIKSLKSKQTGREFFFQDPRTVFKNEKGNYISHDISGFDECFPTVGSSDEKFGQDHGVLWDASWHCEEIDNCLWMSVDRPKGMAVRFQRIASLAEDGSLRLDYQILSLSSQEQPFIYSSHPILALDPDSQIDLPETDKLDVLGHNGILEEVAVQSWPLANLKNGEQVALHKDMHASRQIAGKWFSQTQGLATITFPRSDELLKLRWDKEQLPYMGLWLSMGVPLDPAISEFEKWVCVALEPCTMNHDLLDQVVKPSILAPGESKRFWITWEIEKMESGDE